MKVFGIAAVAATLSGALALPVDNAINDRAYGYNGYGALYGAPAPAPPAPAPSTSLSLVSYSTTALASSTSQSTASSSTTALASSTSQSTASYSTTTPAPAGGSVPPPAPTNDGASSSCSKWYVAAVGDLDACPKALKEGGLSMDDFRSLNPFVDEGCSNLWAGNAYCVQGIPTEQKGIGSGGQSSVPYVAASTPVAETSAAFSAAEASAAETSTAAPTTTGATTAAHDTTVSVPAATQYQSYVSPDVKYITSPAQQCTSTIVTSIVRAASYSTAIVAPVKGYGYSTLTTVRIPVPSSSAASVVAGNSYNTGNSY